MGDGVDQGPVEEPLLAQEPPDPVQPLLVRDAKLGVDRRALEVGGDPALADALGDRAALGLQLAAVIAKGPPPEVLTAQAPAPKTTAPQP